MQLQGGRSHRPCRGDDHGPAVDAEEASAKTSKISVSSNIGLSLREKVGLRITRLEGCRKQAFAKGLGITERFEFMRGCLKQ